MIFSEKNIITQHTTYNNKKNFFEENKIKNKTSEIKILFSLCVVLCCVEENYNGF